MKVKHLGFGALVMTAFVVWAIIGKEGWDGHIMSAAGWAYDWILNPVCEGIIWLLRWIGAYK